MAALSPSWASEMTSFTPFEPPPHEITQESRPKRLGHALGVGATVEAALDGEAGAGGGAGDQLDDHPVGQQGLAAPGLGDEGEQPMLDPVPPDTVIRAQALTCSPPITPSASPKST